MRKGGFVACTERWVWAGPEVLPRGTGKLLLKDNQEFFQVGHDVVGLGRLVG